MLVDSGRIALVFPLVRELTSGYARTMYTTHTSDLSPALVVLIVLAVIWSGIWKAFALYRAGKVHDPGWFVLLLILNTAGILDIFYLFMISKRQSRRQYLER